MVIDDTIDFVEGLFDMTRTKPQLQNTKKFAPTVEGLQAFKTSFANALKSGKDIMLDQLPTCVTAWTFCAEMAISNSKVFVQLQRDDSTMEEKVTFRHKSSTFSHLYYDMYPLSPSHSVFAVLLEAFISSQPEDKRPDVRRKCVLWLEKKHETLGLPVKGFAQEKAMEQAKDDLDVLANLFA